MQAVYLLTLSVVYALGCSSSPSHYELIHVEKDVCSDFAQHNSEPLKATLLYYVNKALHSLYIKEGVRQIRFVGNTSDWHAECWPDKSDFKCALLLGHVIFSDTDDAMGLRPIPFSLAVNGPALKVKVTRLLVHLNVRFQQFKTLRITGIRPFAFTQFEVYPPQNPYLKSLKGTLLSGFHKALNSIDCNSA